MAERRRRHGSKVPHTNLGVAAHAPILYILHFVSTNGSQRGPTNQTSVKNVACLMPPMAYTVIKDRKQLELNIVARARCAFPIPMEFHPVAWLHVPIDLHMGAVDFFAEWNVPIVLRILATIVQRVGGRKRDEAPNGLHYPYVCDTSQMYCNRAEPRVHTARILDATTCWSRPELVDLAVHQIFQCLKSTVTSGTSQKDAATQCRGP